MLSPLMLGGCDAPVEDADERGATDYEWGVSEQAIPCDEQQAIEGYECETADGQQGLQQCLLADGEDRADPAFSAVLNEKGSTIFSSILNQR